MTAAPVARLAIAAIIISTAAQVALISREQYKQRIVDRYEASYKAGYKAGQVDALNGKVKYNLVTNVVQTADWVEVNQQEKPDGLR